MIPEASMQADNLKGPAGIDTLSVTDPTYPDSLFHQGQTSSITTAASAVDVTLDSVVATNPQRFRKGGFFVSLQPRGSDVFIRFRSTSGSPGTTNGAASNGFKMLDGQLYHFFVSQNEKFMDLIATANCSLFWWRSSARKDGYSP